MSSPEAGPVGATLAKDAPRILELARQALDAGDIDRTQPGNRRDHAFSQVVVAWPGIGEEDDFQRRLSHFQVLRAKRARSRVIAHPCGIFQSLV